MYGHIRPYTAIYEHPGPYTAIQDHIRPSRTLPYPGTTPPGTLPYQELRLQVPYQDRSPGTLPGPVSRYPGGTLPGGTLVVPCQEVPWYHAR